MEGLKATVVLEVFCRKLAKGGENSIGMRGCQRAEFQSPPCPLPAPPTPHKSELWGL